MIYLNGNNPLHVLWALSIPVGGAWFCAWFLWSSWFVPRLPREERWKYWAKAVLPVIPAVVLVILEAAGRVHVGG